MFNPTRAQSGKVSLYVSSFLGVADPLGYEIATMEKGLTRGGVGIPSYLGLRVSL